MTYKINTAKLLEGMRLTRDLDRSRLTVERIRKMRNDSLADIFEDLYNSFDGSVVPRVEGKGINLIGIFAEYYEKGGIRSSPATLGMLVHSGNVAEYNEDHQSLLYVRFNTEELMNLPPEKDYTSLNALMDKYVSEIDPNFIESARAPPFREWEVKVARKAAQQV